MIKAVIFDMYETLITLLEGPMYFGAHMAADSGIEKEKFLSMWNEAEEDRTVGKRTLEETVAWILKENNRYSEDLLTTLVQKRKDSRKACFDYLHPEIIPMFEELKKRGFQIGLISNCFSEEVEAIRESILFPYFDVACLSFEKKVQKPDEAIFIGCMKELEVMPQECLYVGDGGSFELEAASKLGMNVLQATWYLKEGTWQPAKRKPEFTQAETPMEVVEYSERL